MDARKRWQDWANVVIGVLLFITPFVFGGAAMPKAEYAHVVLGVLLFVGALYLLANPEHWPVEWAQIVFGALSFIAPWVLGYTQLAQMAWSAWILGGLAVICAASALYQAIRPGRLARS